MRKKRSGPGRPRKSLNMDTIINRATEVFSKKGYSGATLDEIAKKLNIKKPSLIHHCNNKKALYIKIVDITTVNIKNYIEQGILDKLSFVEKLDYMGRQITAYFRDNPASAKLMMRELIDNGPAFSGEGQSAVQNVLNTTAEFLKSGMNAGVFVKQDPKHLALSIIGIHMYFFSTTDSTEIFLNGNAYNDTGIEKRLESVLYHVRKITLAD